MPHTLLTTLNANVPSGAWTASTVPFHEARLERHRTRISRASQCKLPGGRCVKVSKTVDVAGFAIEIERLDGDGNKSALVFGLTPDAAMALSECLKSELSNNGIQRQSPHNPAL